MDCFTPIARIIIRDDGDGNGLILGSFLRGKGKGIIDFDQVYELCYDNVLGSGFSFRPIGKSTVQQVYENFKRDHSNFVQAWHSSADEILQSGREVFFTQAEMKQVIESEYKAELDDAIKHNRLTKCTHEAERFWIKPRPDLGDNLFEVENNCLNGLRCGDIIELDSVGNFVKLVSRFMEQ